MKTSEINQQGKIRKNPKANQSTRNKSIVKETDAEGLSPYVDLDRADFTRRKHGRTTKFFGPDHEPGTV